MPSATTGGSSEGAKFHENSSPARSHTRAGSYVQSDGPVATSRAMIVPSQVDVQRVVNHIVRR